MPGHKNEERLYRHLFDNGGKNYSRFTRPVERAANRVLVNLTLEMLQIVLLDEKVGSVSFPIF